MKSVELREIPTSPSNDYQAGSDGRIWSRLRCKSPGRTERVDWYPLKGYRSKKGYMTITLSHKKNRMTKSVHRLVCMAFHGMPEPSTLQVRHLDGNPENNRPDNLKWGTQQDNWLDRKAHGNGIEGEKHWNAKLTDAEREHLRWAIKRGLCSRRHAARVLGMSQASISAIAKGIDTPEPR